MLIVSSKRLFIPLTVSLMPKKSIVFHWGGKLCFFVESLAVLLTDRCGMIKVNHTVPVTTIASLFHHLFSNKAQQPYLVVWLLQNTEDIFFEKQEGTETDDKEATIQTATGGERRRGTT